MTNHSFQTYTPETPGDSTRNLSQANLNCTPQSWPRPYCATFVVFTDYMRAAMRLSALCESGVQLINLLSI